MGKFISIFAGIGIFVLTIILIAFICGFPTMLLWNWLMPDIFGLPRINYWQAMGLMMLCSILFKSNNSKKEE